MHKAFRRYGDAVVALALTLFLLALPFIFEGIKPRSRESTWTSIRTSGGPIGYIDYVFYKDHKQDDIVLLGNSRLLHGLDRYMIADALTKHLNRPASVASLCIYRPGVDICYVMLKDYLASHPKPHLIILHVPYSDLGQSDTPHDFIKYCLREGDYPDFTSGLSGLQKTQVYAEMVAGAPRQLLNAIRPNTLAADEMNAESVFSDAFYEDSNQAFNGEHPFVQEQLIEPSSPLQGLWSVTSPKVRVMPPPLGKYQAAFVRKIVDLAAADGIPICFIHMPFSHEANIDYFPEPIDYASVAGSGAQILGLTLEQVYPGRTSISNVFYDYNHFNRNGSRQFTSDLIPSIIKAYDTIQATKR